MNPLLAVVVCEQLAELARTGQTEALLELLRDESPNVVDPKDDSLLMLAAYHGHARTVEALLARGADPSLRNARGLSPLDGAAFKGWEGVIGALLRGGADVNDSGPDGRTPLMWAAAFGRERAVHLLLAQGANLQALDRAGLSAEAHARSMGHQLLASTVLRAEPRESRESLAFAR